MNMFSEYYDGKKILVTGGAGSIGKKIVKELIKYDVDVIRVFDNNETELFDLDNDLKSSKVKIFIGDIKDIQRLKYVFKDVDIIFHAAAYKHVPLCEYNPLDAVKTNILGTQNIIDMSIFCDVDKVVLISTDKAVHPANVMGATKFLAEKLIMAASANSDENSTKFSCVRFGNVLNSRGSVIPLFKKQLKHGGPITLTDEDMTRFVMNIYQAAELILEAGSISQGGEVFILKMPAFKVSDLVCAMIEHYAPQYGYKKDDIEVKIIGKRAGEKLYEELMTSDEMLNSFDNGNLFIIRDEINKNHNDFVYNSKEIVHLSKEEIIDILQRMDDKGY